MLITRGFEILDKDLPDTFDFKTILGDDNVKTSARGTSDRDVYKGHEGDDTYYAGDGDDLVLGKGGDDSLFGEDGKDHMAGGEGNDLLNGGADDDTLHGQDGNDTLLGEDGNDKMFGGNGSDNLDGGDGEDFIAGGAGNDIMTGGADKDTFWFDPTETGHDVITDFEDGLDMISFHPDDYQFVPIGFGDLTITDTADGARIEFGNSSILVENVTAAELDTNDFMF